MIYVTSFDGTQQEPLINISDDFKLEQSVDGSFQISFTCFPQNNNPGYDVLTSQSVITVDGNDFRVNNYSSNQFSKSVTALSVFFDQSKTQRLNYYEGNHTLASHLAFALNGTGWTYTVDSDISNLINYIENLGQNNVVSILNRICQYHNCEYVILPNKNLRISRQIGADNDYQYRYKHNVSSVVLTENTTNLYTFIRGYGAEGLEVSYTSPNVSIFGILEAAPIRDTRFTDLTSLRNFIARSITDVPELAIQSTIPELTEREIGERVWLIYEPLNVEMQTRILKQTKVLRNEKLITSDVTLGNTLIKTAIDIFVEQKEEIDDNQKNINETKEELTETSGELRSEIIVTNDRIALEVENLNQSISAVNIRADAIDISVTNLANNTSASINLLSNNINLKVDKGGTITDINLSPGNATINAEKINLNGAVFVNGMITGSTSIEVSTDVILGRQLRFSDFTALTTGGGNLTLEAFNNINYVASTHFFNGTVDFSNSMIRGVENFDANSVNGLRFSSDNDRLYVYRGNSYLGEIVIDFPG